MLKRRISAGVAGFVLGAIAVAALLWLGHRLFGVLTPGVEPTLPVLGAVLFAYLIGGVIGTAVATQREPDNRRIAPIVVVQVAMVLTLMTVFNVPSPGWYIAAALFIWVPAGWIGIQIGKRMRASA